MTTDYFDYAHWQTIVPSTKIDFNPISTIDAIFTPGAYTPTVENEQCAPLPFPEYKDEEARKEICELKQEIALLKLSLSDLINHMKSQPQGSTPMAQLKCECGGEKARTTHSTWCPKF